MNFLMCVGYRFKLLAGYIDSFCFSMNFWKSFVHHKDLVLYCDLRRETSAAKTRFIKCCAYFPLSVYICVNKLIQPPYTHLCFLFFLSASVDPSSVIFFSLRPSTSHQSPLLFSCRWVSLLYPSSSPFLGPCPLHLWRRDISLLITTWVSFSFPPHSKCHSSTSYLPPLLFPSSLRIPLVQYFECFFYKLSSFIISSFFLFPIPVFYLEFEIRRERFH